MLNGLFFMIMIDQRQKLCRSVKMKVCSYVIFSVLMSTERKTASKKRVSGQLFLFKSTSSQTISLIFASSITRYNNLSLASSP